MKNIFVFILIFHVVSLFPQQNNIPLLERAITLEISNQPLKEILKKIETQANFSFSYNPQIIDDNQLMSVFLKKKSVRDALNQLLGEKVNYKAKGNYIILTKRKEVATQPVKTDLVISGYIYDKENGNKLPDVTIYEKKNLISATTDQFGYFNLKVPKEQNELTLFVKKQEYEDTIIVIKPLNNYYLSVNIRHVNTDTLFMISKTLSDSITKQIHKLSVINWLLTEKLVSNTKNLLKDTILKNVQISFLPFISTNNLLGGNVVNDYSFNIIAGYSKGVNKMELGGVMNIDRGNVKSLQLAGFGNMVGGNVSGFQGAGFMNMNYGKTDGLQAAGFMNTNFDSLCGVQLAGFMNTQLKSFDGLQAAGFMNTSIGNSKGLQLAGFMNTTTDSMNGVQAAGFCNHSVKYINGAQISGFYNIAANEVDGAQISGFFNYAKKVKGTQVSFINISDTCSGLPIGFFSYVKKGYHRIELSTDEVMNANVSFRTGVNRFHNIFSVGIQLPEVNKPIWSFGYGIGTTYTPRPKWAIDVDLISHQLMKQNNISSVNNLNRLYVGAEYKLTNKFAIAAGPYVNVYLVDITDKNYSKVFSDILPGHLYNETYKNDINMKISVGGKLAIRFL